MTAKTPTDEGTSSRFSIPSARGIANILLTIVLIAAIVPFVVYAVPGVVGAEGSYVVLSGSMEPSIHTGDVVLVYPADPSAIEVGDVITFSRDGTRVPVTHRVIEVNPTNDVDSGVIFHTMGDANEDPDQASVPGSAVLGVVPTVTVPGYGEALLRFPYLGRVVAFANTGLGFGVLVALPLAAFILNEIWTVARSRRDDPDAATAPADDATTTTAQAAPASDAGTSPDGETAMDAHGAADLSPTGDAGLVAESVPTRKATAAAAVPSHQAGPAQEGEVEFDPGDLTTTTIVLALAAVYSVWVAYVDFAPWSVAVAVAAVGSTLYVQALRMSARSTPAPAAQQMASQSRTDGGHAETMSADESAVRPESTNPDDTTAAGADTTTADRVDDGPTGGEDR